MADIESDGDGCFETDEDSEEELESTARVLDIASRQCSLITHACSLIVELLDEDDDRMGDHQDGEHSVDPLRGAYDFFGSMLSGHESRFYRVVGFTIPEWEVIELVLQYN